MRRLEALRHENAAIQLETSRDHLNGRIDDRDQTDRDESRLLEERYLLARNELESARLEIGVLQAQVSELSDLRDKLKEDVVEAIGAQRSIEAEFRAEIEAQRVRHTEQIEQIEQIHARAEANAQLVEQLKAEILSIAQTIRAQYRPRGSAE